VEDCANRPGGIRRGTRRTKKKEGRRGSKEEAKPEKKWGGGAYYPRPVAGLSLS
jgi:hypothetical protein